MNYHRDEDYLKYESLFENIFRKRFKLIKSHSRGGISTVLDIGCSNGVFLDLFTDRETWGIEPSGSGEIARKKGHKIIKDYFENLPAGRQEQLPNDYFDLVILNHTLEHMDNPKKIIEKINILLKKGGIVFIDVPNFGSLLSKILGKKWPYLLPKEHKSQFTKESLTKLLQENGFDILYWESRSGIFEYANPLKELGRKRFLLDLFAIPYTLFATLLGMGDSMSFIAKKK